MSADPRGSPARTLVVDDVERLREFVADALDEADSFHLAGQARDGKEAIERARDLEPDLVLLDLSMPRMDGLEALAQIRREVPSADVVVHSGFTSERMAAIARDHGALAYIEKGIEPDELLQRLAGLLDGSTPGPDGTEAPRPAQTGDLDVHILGIDAQGAKRIEAVLRESNPGWRLTRARHSEQPVPGHAQVVIVAIESCEQDWAQHVRSLSPRYPEVPVVLAVPSVPDGGLQRAIQAGATDVLETDHVDGGTVATRVRWALELERRHRARTRHLDVLAGTMAHDLKSPLRAIERYAEWVDEGLDAGDQVRIDEALEGLQRGAERARRIIDRQLAYARVQTKPPAASDTDPREAVGEALEDLQGAIDRSGARIEIGSLPRVLAPPEHLVVLFRNLLSNAIKYREQEQRPRVEVTGETVDRQAVIRIADDGIGIDPDYQDEVFDPFTRLHAEQDYPGTGLGLAICQRIVEQWGGTIGVDSQPGEGTTFALRLPGPTSG